MCGRYVLGEINELQLRFQVPPLPENEALEPRFNVAPSQVMPVVTRHSPNQLELMSWGLIPSWIQDVRFARRPINARAETVATLASFRTPFRIHRCLVPASGFYEWHQGRDGKTPFFIHRKDQQLFAFAGIYDVWMDRDGRAVLSYAIITTTPNALMEKLHNRMPVILSRDAEEIWLNQKEQDDSKLLRLLVPYPAAAMAAHPVSRRVNSPANDDPELVQPAA